MLNLLQKSLKCFDNSEAVFRVRANLFEGNIQDQLVRWAHFCHNFLLFWGWFLWGRNMIGLSESLIFLNIISITSKTSIKSSWTIFLRWRCRLQVFSQVLYFPPFYIFSTLTTLNLTWFLRTFLLFLVRRNKSLLWFSIHYHLRINTFFHLFNLELLIFFFMIIRIWKIQIKIKSVVALVSVFWSFSTKRK